jgi:hypothetical protein
MGTVIDLCTSCVLLEHGVVRAIDSPRAISDLYFASRASGARSVLTFPSDGPPPGDDVAKLVSARLIVNDLDDIAEFDRCDSVDIEMTFELLKPGYRPVPNFHVFLQDQYVFVSSPQQNSELAPGIHKSTMRIPSNFLNTGFFVVGIALTSLDPTKVHFYLREALRFHVVERDAKMPLGVPGPIRPQLEWNVTRD